MSCKLCMRSGGEWRPAYQACCLTPTGVLATQLPVSVSNRVAFETVVRETIRAEELVVRGASDLVTPMSMIGPVTLHRQSNATPPMLAPVGCALLLDLEVVAELQSSGEALECLPVLEGRTGRPSNYGLVCYTESAWSRSLLLEQESCPSCGYPRVRKRWTSLTSIAVRTPRAVVGIASTLTVAVSETVRQAVVRRGAPAAAFEALEVHIGGEEGPEVVGPPK